MTPYSRLTLQDSPLDSGAGAKSRPSNDSVPARRTGTAGGQVDLDRAARAVRELLIAIGEDPEREGLLDTPARVARAFKEMCSGMYEDAGVHLARRFRQETKEVVLVTDLEVASLCEHHLLPFTGRAQIAYLPSGGEVVGLSKLARTVQVFARRPQLQERLTAEVADALVRHLEPAGVLVIVEAEHQCLRVRGARSPSASMTTTAHRGVFRDNPVFREEVHRLIASRRAVFARAEFNPPDHDR